jgi:hypothetical protein
MLLSANTSPKFIESSGRYTYNISTFAVDRQLTCVAQESFGCLNVVLFPAIMASVSALLTMTTECPDI